MPETLIRSKLLAALPGVDHGFTTRLTPAELDRTIMGAVSTAKQVHQADFIFPDRFEQRQRDADGVGTLAPKYYVGVYSADCTPVLLVLAERGVPIGAMAVHAGWRGTAQRITLKAVETLARKAGRPRPELTLHAAIGPCISYESFEVGQDVIDAFPRALDHGLARRYRMEDGKQKYLFDLAGENLRQLQAATAGLGLKLAAESLGRCTLTEAATFPSFRRDRKSEGRILSYLAFGTDRPLGA
jgi:YfiH family protein